MSHARGANAGLIYAQARKRARKHGVVDPGLEDLKLAVKQRKHTGDVPSEERQRVLRQIEEANRGYRPH
jgi:hypothetical protein